MMSVSSGCEEESWTLLLRSHTAKFSKITSTLRLGQDFALLPQPYYSACGSVSAIKLHFELSCSASSRWRHNLPFAHHAQLLLSLIICSTTSLESKCSRSAFTRVHQHTYSRARWMTCSRNAANGRRTRSSLWSPSLLFLKAATRMRAKAQGRLSQELS